MRHILKLKHFKEFQAMHYRLINHDNSYYSYYIYTAFNHISVIAIIAITAITSIIALYMGFSFFFWS